MRDDLNVIFDESLTNEEGIGLSHYYSSCVYEFSQMLQCNDERRILGTVASQVESAALISTLGLYRQAFASLRLALEMGLGAVYFSVHRLELHEWMDGKADIKWSLLISDDKGVLSKRFSNAFFKELSEEMEPKREFASKIYRTLSEFVHGNYGTWSPDGMKLTYNSELYVQYKWLCKQVFEIIMFSLCCRYLKSMSAESLDNLGFIAEELGHISPIREILGGPKEVK